MITFDEFQKIEIKIGNIVTAEKIPDTDKLLKLSVSFGEESRQIVSGIALYFSSPDVLIGRKCAFVTNLEPRMIKGYESQGMILAVSTEPGQEGEVAFSLLTVSEDIPDGTRVK